MQRITGLTEFGKYINKIVTIDALFLNEDRHMHNIAVLAGPKGKYDYCPIFDNGGGLLSDTMLEYPMGTELLGLLKSVRAKTFSHDFDTQLAISEQLYGENIKFHYTQNDVNHLLDTVGNYDDEIKERVKEIIFDRMRKYAYLFEKKYKICFFSVKSGLGINDEIVEACPLCLNCERVWDWRYPIFALHRLFQDCCIRRT